MENQDIIFLFSYEWENNWGRPHQIMTRLARNNRVVWVESPLSLLHTLKNRKQPWVHWKKGLYKVRPNLWVYRIPYLIPASGFVPVFWKLNRRIIVNSLKKQIRKLKFHKPILWIYHPIGGDYFVGKFNEIFSCYDCADEYLGGKRFEKLHYKNERKLSKAVDVVFVSSNNLYKRHKRYNPETYLIPNGADVDLIRKILMKNSSIPADINIKKPIIGYIGGISFWIDFELIKLMAEKHPEWQIVMIGPILCKIAELKKIQNVRFLGMKLFENIPLYVREFSVGIIPFKINTITKAVSPIKLFEYLATGIPVVSVDLPEVEKFKPIVKVGYTREDFIAKIEESINKPEPLEMQKKRIKIAQENSWDERVGEMTKIIDIYLRTELTK